MNHEEQDDLWELLGKARQPKERPFFSAKVLRAVQEEREESAPESGGLWQAIRRRWLLPLAGCSVAAIAIFFAVAPQGPESSTVHPSETVAVTPVDPLAPLAINVEISDELAASLDNFLATQDNALWLQADPSSPY